MIYDSKDLYIRKCFLILLILIMMSSVLKLVEWFKTLRIEIRQYQIVPQRLHFRKFFGDLVNFFWFLLVHVTSLAVLPTVAIDIYYYSSKIICIIQFSL